MTMPLDLPGAPVGAAETAAAAPTAAAPAPAPLDDAGATAQRQLVLSAARARHWQRTSRLTSALLLAWLITTFCSAFFARELAGLTVFGWPLSFYLAAQGAALIYLAIVAVYALTMRRLDADFHHGQDAAAPAANKAPASAAGAGAKAGAVAGAGGQP
jgi:putative solute:sodium symporter small subunit